MTHRLLSLLLASMLSISLVKADEGMWMLPYIKDLNIEQMQKLGANLTAEQIYSINNSSIKDAIVIFGGGCTGELISDEGLILTNHHCGYATIQQHSSVEHNYLKDGFWAMSRADEIVSPDLSVKFLNRIEDVSERVSSALKIGMSEVERSRAIDSTLSVIKKEVPDSLGYEPVLKPFYSGNAYYLFVYQRYTDVRFVGAPPSSIGKFGADTDNWMWPRHTCDFSMFRVYADSSGNPAEFSELNVPLKPKHHLPISLKGNAENDFAMILGFPGSTDRFLTSWGIEERMEIINAARIIVRAAKQDVWLKDMNANEKVRIQYASKYARSSNYYKNSIGMNKGLTNLKVLDKKRAIEDRFKEWVAADDTRNEKYGEALSLLKNGYQNRAEHNKARNFLNESLVSGAEIFSFAMKISNLSNALKKDNAKAINYAVEKFKAYAKDFYKDYNPETDKKVVAAMLEVYANEIHGDYQPSVYSKINKKYKGDYELYAEKLFKNSMFASKEKLFAFLENPKYSKIIKDMAVVDGRSIMDQYRVLYELARQEDSNIEKGKRLFEAGLLEMDSTKVFYPDANFTMRMSYGKVDDYMARDAVHYLHFTTLKGVMEKEDPNNWEFVVPHKLKELYETKDYGSYADTDGTLHVNFLTDNDITGGNSGSPVINANGELFGLAFDGNWEAMSGDIAFEPELQRTINVDIRYVLFIIDKFAGAKHLIDEMTIRR